MSENISHHSRSARSLKLFGKLRFVLSDATEMPWCKGSITGGLLAILAAHKGKEKTRDQIASLLWVDDPTEVDLKNRLKQTVKKLHTDLALYNAEGWLVTSQGLALHPDAHSDLDDFYSALATCQANCVIMKETAEKERLAEIAKEIIQHRKDPAEFLVEYEMAWVREYRNDLRNEWNRVTGELYDHLHALTLETENDSHFVEASDYACLCLALRPKALDMYLVIMRLWARQGQPSQVIEWYERWLYQMSILQLRPSQEEHDYYRKLLNLARTSMVSINSDNTIPQTDLGLTQDEQDAARLYTLGRSLWDERTEENLQQAYEKFKTAVDKAEYPLAYSGCADALSLLAYYGLRPSCESYAEAINMARRALRLDPEMAEGHTSMGWIALVYHWDWEGARQAFSRALELQPDYRTANHWYSFYLMLTAKTKRGKADLKRIELSLQHLKEAFSSDPYSPIFIKSRGERHFYAGDYEKALEEFERSLLQAPQYSLTYFCMAQTLEQLSWTHRDNDKTKSEEYSMRAIAAFRDAARYSANGLFRDSIQAGLAHALATTKQQIHIDEAKHIVLDLLKQRMQPQDANTQPCVISAYALAVAHLGLGDYIQTENWLQEAAKERPGDAVVATVDPRFVRQGYMISLDKMQLKFVRVLT